MKKLGGLFGLFRCQVVHIELHQIGSQFIFVFVDQIFLFLNFVELIIWKIFQQCKGATDIFVCFLCHSVDCKLALCDCQWRIIEETFLKKIEICLLFVVFIGIFNKEEDKLFNLADKWSKNKDRQKPEYRIQKCHTERWHNFTHKWEMHDGIYRIEYDGPENHTK